MASLAAFGHSSAAASWTRGITTRKRRGRLEKGTKLPLRLESACHAAGCKARAIGETQQGSEAVRSDRPNEEQPAHGRLEPCREDGCVLDATDLRPKGLIEELEAVDCPSSDDLRQIAVFKREALDHLCLKLCGMQLVRASGRRRRLLDQPEASVRRRWSRTLTE
jgi:hypothetical protein